MKVIRSSSTLKLVEVEHKGSVQFLLIFLDANGKLKDVKYCDSESSPIDQFVNHLITDPLSLELFEKLRSNYYLISLHWMPEHLCWRIDESRYYIKNYNDSPDTYLVLTVEKDKISKALFTKLDSAMDYIKTMQKFDNEIFGE